LSALPFLHGHDQEDEAIDGLVAETRQPTLARLTEREGRFTKPLAAIVGIGKDEVMNILLARRLAWMHGRDSRVTIFLTFSR
jgi:hypothetical protein